VSRSLFPRRNRALALFEDGQARRLSERKARHALVRRFAVVHRAHEERFARQHGGDGKDRVEALEDGAEDEHLRIESQREEDEYYL
jgi:hypothetical protein